MAPLEPRRIRIIVAGQVTELRAERTRDTAEMVLGILRVAEDKVLFTRPRRGPVVDLVDWIAKHRHRAEHPDRPLPQKEAGASASAVAAMVARRAAGIARARQEMAREGRQ
jgi:hypothetical protein